MKNKITIRMIWVVGLLSLFQLAIPIAGSSSTLLVTVEVIKADKDSKVVDPQLKDLMNELGPVLNFTGFTLIKKSAINLGINKKEQVILPAERRLVFEFLGLEDDKARLLVKILEKETETFRTTLLMVNKGSAMIGGPPHENGVLLLRIGAGLK